MRKADDHAGDALVAHQHLRPAAQQPDLQPFVAAAPDDCQQLVDRSRLGEILCRPAQLEPGALGQRHLFANTIDSTHGCHVQSTLAGSPMLTGSRQSVNRAVVEECGGVE